MTKRKETSKLLSGKTAIVTGASSGIGRATALTLAQAGAAVVIHARRKERLAKVVLEIEAQGGKAYAVAGDAGIPSDIDKLLERTLRWKEGGGKYDIVVVNAGRGLAGSTLASDTTQWQALYQLNVIGAAHLMRQAGRYMAEKKNGAIAEGLRQEVCAQGVRVSLVMPGIVESEFQKVAGYTEDFGKGIAYMGKLLEPQAIADGICWLLSQPPHVNVSEIMIRPTGQNHP